MAERGYSQDIPQLEKTGNQIFKRAQYLGYTAMALVALACSDGSEKGASSTASASRSDLEDPVTITTVPPRADLIPTVIIPRPDATPTPRPLLPPPPQPSRDGALRLDGRQDAVQIGSDGINLNKNFKIIADVLPEDEGFSAGGDTILSKGNDMAFYLRSPNVNCVGNIGALLDGVDFCTSEQVMRGVRSTIGLEYNGKDVIFTINGRNITVKEKQGPLPITTRDILVGTRPPLGGLNRQPLKGSIFDLRVVEEGVEVIHNPFNTEQDLTNTGPGIRRTQPLGEPKIQP